MIAVPEIFYSPQKTLAEIKASPRPAQSLLAAMSAWLSFITGILLIIHRTVTLKQFFAVYLFTFIFFLLLVFFKTLLVHFFAEVLGGDGKITLFIFLLAYSMMPLHFFLPVGLLMRQAPMFYILAVSLICVGWAGVLGLEALKVHYGLSWGKSLAAGLAPFLFLILVPVLIALTAFFAGLTLLISQLSTRFAL